MIILIHQENIPFCLQGTRKTLQNHNATPQCVFKAWRIFFTHQLTYSLRRSHWLVSISTTSSRSLPTPVLCVYLLEEMKMGWERRTDGASATRGARVSVELPSNVSALPDVSVLSEPSKTSVQGPAATSIMLPAEREEGGRSRCQPRTSRLPGVFPLLVFSIQ